jgi:hypothetical protein
MPDFPNSDPLRPFGMRNARQAPIAPPPVITHAPQGLGGDKPPHDRRRLRSIAVVVGVWGLATIAGLALVQSMRRHCENSDPGDWGGTNEANCSQGGGHGGGGGGGVHFSGSGGASQGSASFGGFGGTGEGGGHGGGGE